MPKEETRILASLEHPYIARFLDAGATRTGLRYLVMEFVDGEPCTEYAARYELTEESRLKLFLQICEAVQYANRSLVIHCDLKPANVLVSTAGEVKLLDFGISRVLSEAAGGDRATRLRFYSPDYASPEQILGEPLTVATDVYSLGALLCELAGGRAPRALAKASLEETVRAVREEAGELPVRGDLEQIVRKALRVDAAQRYGTVEELAGDVKRYLAGLPVEARAPSVGYRVRKFLWRNRLAAVAATVVIVGMLTGAGVAIRQRQLAQERFGQIRKLANSLLFEIHDAIEPLPGSLKARHLLVDRSVTYLDALAEGAGADEAIQLEAAKGYIRLANVEGVGNEASLGVSGQALPRLEKADRMVAAVLARSPGNRDAQRARYDSLEALATIYTMRADARSVATAEELVRVAERNAAATLDVDRVAEELAHARATLAFAYSQSKTEGAKGVGAWAKAVGDWRALHEAKPERIVRKREWARAQQFYAGALSRAGKKDEALAEIKVAYRMHKELAQVPGEDVIHLLATDVGLMGNLAAQGKRYAEAIPYFQEQLQLREGLLARDPNNAMAKMGVAGTLNRIGYAYVLLKQPDKGIPYLERSLAMQKTRYEKDPENVLVSREMLYAYADLTDAYEVKGQRARMCASAVEAGKVMKGAISRTRETPTDAAKKKYVLKILAVCGVSGK